MSKVILSDLANLQNETTATGTINANSAVIETAFDNTLSRDGTTPNQMEASLDMNSNRILNLAAPISQHDPVRLEDLGTFASGGTINFSSLPTGGTVKQVLTKNSSTNYDVSWKTPDIVYVTPEQFGYTTYGSGDAGPAIQLAINSIPRGTGGKVVFGEHSYTIVTPIVISNPYIWLQGQGNGTTLFYAPTSDNTSMITWSDVSVTTGLYFGRMTDFQIGSNNAFVKTAIHLIDIGDMEVSGLYFPIWTDPTFNSIALKTNGRQTSSFHDLRIFADIPIYLDVNPNTALSTDHFHFWNLYLIPAAVRNCVTIGNIWVTNTTFDGFQAWVGGTHGVYYNAPSPAALHAFGLSFYNVRVEEGTDPTGYSFYINTPSGLNGLLLKNCKMDQDRKGFYGRYLESASLEQVYYSVVSPTSKVAVDIDTSCGSVLLSNCHWESGCTLSLGGLANSYSYTTPATSPIATNALYHP